MNYNRIFLVVLDSVGIGASYDSADYNDLGSNTLLNTINKTNVTLPNLEKLGLLHLVNKSTIETIGSYTSAQSISKGKDTLTGHLEIVGVKTTNPAVTFTQTGFPKELIDQLEKLTNRKVIGNISASGTEIIENLGEEHMKTGNIIVYTSADSVLQIAAHEDIVPLEELYSICETARKITLKQEWKVGRIIARPFIGTLGNFERTSNRRDYALNPPKDTILNYLKNNKYDVISIGKINDIFNGSGITENFKINDNKDGLIKIIETIKNKQFKGLCFANLNDFDSLYGHRRNPEGYAMALKEVDNYIPQILKSLNNDDLLIITADHGNDPTYTGTDHTREKIPVLIYSNKITNPKYLKELNTFADIGATIAENFNVEQTDIGTSFLNKL